QPVGGVIFHSEDKDVYSAGSDNKLHRWSIAEGKKAAEVNLGGEAYKVTPAGESFFVGSAGNNVRQFVANDQKQLREFSGAKDWVLATAYHDGSKRIAGGTFDGQVFVWNADDGSAITSFYAAPGYQPAK